MSGREDFEERKQARIERLRAGADRLRSEGNARLSSARKIAEIIPLGQPILIGHHSEKRHRRDLAKINANYDKGFEAIKKAEELASRASFAERSRAISSDDPNAPDAIKAKIERIEKLVAEMKACNALIRKAKGDNEKGIELLCASGYGFSREQAADLLKPDFAGRIGFAPYELTNRGAEARRLKKRLEVLQEQEKLQALPDETYGDYIVLSESNNRTRLHFFRKPSDAIRDRLKRAGFRWAPTTGAWQRMSSASARHHAKIIAQDAAKESEGA
jgi:hypothetical protein